MKFGGKSFRNLKIQYLCSANKKNSYFLFTNGLTSLFLAISLLNNLIESAPAFCRLV